MNITFEKEGHIYTVNGEVWPSVSEILRRTGMVEVNKWWLPIHRERGTWVHDLCARYDRGEDVEPYLTGHPEWRGYVQAYVRFCADWSERYRPVEVEEPVCHPVLKYCGCPDRLALLDGDACIVDLKTGEPQLSWGVQMSGYGLCFDPHIKRMVVKLDREGGYSTRFYGEEIDNVIWMKTVDTYLKRFRGTNLARIMKEMRKRREVGFPAIV